MANYQSGPFASNVDLILSTGAALTESLSLWLARFPCPGEQNSAGHVRLQFVCLKILPLTAVSVVHGNRALPTWPGLITVKALGLDVGILNPDGGHVAPGQMGKLVCKRPFPNMPVCFLHDPQKSRYFATYFSQIAREYRSVNRFFGTGPNKSRCVDAWRSHQSRSQKRWLFHPRPKVRMQTRVLICSFLVASLMQFEVTEPSTRQVCVLVHRKYILSSQDLSPPQWWTLSVLGNTGSLKI